MILLLNLESKTHEKLKEAIIGNIGKLSNMISTLTQMIARGVDEKMADLIPDIIPQEKKPLVPSDMNEEEEYDDEDDDFEEKKK